MNTNELEDLYALAFSDDRNTFHWTCEQCDHQYHTDSKFAPICSQLKRACYEYKSGISSLCYELPSTCHECLSFLCVNCIYSACSDAIRNNRETVQCPLCDTSAEIDTLETMLDDQLIVQMIDAVHDEFLGIKDGRIDASTNPFYLEDVFARLSFVVNKIVQYDAPIQKYVCSVQMMLMGVPVFNMVRPLGLGEGNCTICMQDRPIFQLACSHQACNACLRDWLQKSPSAGCPFCRHKALRKFCGISF